MFLIFAVVNNIKFNMKKIFLTTIIMVLAAALAQAGDITRLPLLQVGKVWDYDYSWVDISFQRNSGSARIWVEDETLIGEKRLCRVCLTNSEKGEKEVSEQLWYEEDGKVYTCNDRGEVQDLLYDFTLSVGDAISGNGLFPDGFTVAEADSVLVDGTVRRRLTLSHPDWEEKVTWVEGIGGTGVLYEPVMHTVSDGRKYSLTSCSMDGECIFTREDFSTQAYRITDGIFLPTAQTADPKENPIHDLQGRRLSSIPQKGIYIRNGRKYVR